MQSIKLKISKIVRLLIITLITSCSKSDQESIQGVWQPKGDAAKNVSKMLISGDQIIVEFAEESKPGIATFTLFEKGEKKWISIKWINIVRESKEAKEPKEAFIQEYRLDDNSLSFHHANGTSDVEFER